MTKDMEKKLQKSQIKDRFPRIVIIIILSEFCERLSFSGMRAFLTLYLRSKLGFSDEGATETYHIFCTVVYISPIIGGIVSDNYLGKFRTIIYMMAVYAAGNLLVALTAIPQLALPGRLFTTIGLVMVTLGTGGIKPCVTAFGGDQFKLPEQEHHLAVYFSVFYFTLCLAGLLAKTISPILRSEVHCFGDKDCYSLAFGAPGLVIIISMVIFISAKRRYVMKQPEGNVVYDFIRCISLGIKNVIMRRNRGDENSHWLDSTRPKYDVKFIEDVKQMLSLLTMFTVVPVFWALTDQFGSRWTLQASRMNGSFGFMRINPDQVLVLLPIFYLTMIPITQKCIFPFFETRNILKSPLHKVTLGGFLIAIAFISSGTVEIYLKTTYPQLPQEGYSQLRIFNGESCQASVFDNDVMYVVSPLGEFTKKDIEVHGFKNVTMRLEGSCFGTRDETFLMEENSAISYFLNGDEVLRFKDKIEKSKSGFPIVRFLISGENSTNIYLYNDKSKEIEAYINETVSSQMEVFASTYSIKVGDEVKQSNIEIKGGGVYTIMIDNTEVFKSEVKVVTVPNSITMAWLLPQFFLLATGELLLTIQGNEFAFKESPESMKAVMTAVWLMTEAFGNVIIIIVTRLLANYQQETQSFFYTGLMLCALVVFLYQARGYQSVHEKFKKQRRKSETVNLNGTTEDRSDEYSLLRPGVKNSS